MLGMGVLALIYGFTSSIYVSFEYLIKLRLIGNTEIHIFKRNYQILKW